jgi:cytochrome c oxidase subunit 4
MVHPVTAPGGAPAATTAAHASHPKPKYMLIWLYLAVLTAIEVSLTYVVSYLGFSKRFTIFALLLLAVWKAVLVALYYMHLRFEPTRLRLLALAPLPLAIILVVAVLTEF